MNWNHSTSTDLRFSQSKKESMQNIGQHHDFFVMNNDFQAKFITIQELWYSHWANLYELQNTSCDGLFRHDQTIRNIRLDSIEWVIKYWTCYWTTMALKLVPWSHKKIFQHFDSIQCYYFRFTKHVNRIQAMFTELIETKKHVCFLIGQFYHNSYQPIKLEF